VLKKIVTLYMSVHGMRNSNQILHGHQTIFKKSYMVDHATCLGQLFLTIMLMRDLFALANLLVYIV